MSRFQFHGISETKEANGYADSISQAKDMIRKQLSGEKIDWDNNVVIVKVGE